MAGDIKHQDFISIPDDPAVTAAGGITPSKFNKSLRLSGGTDGQILVRSTPDDPTTGMKLTSTPTLTAVLFPLNTDPLTLSIGGMTVVDDGTTLTIYIKRADGSLASLVFG